MENWPRYNTYEYKKGKLNKSVEALSGNPVISQEDTDSCDSYDSDDSSYSEKSTKEAAHQDTPNTPGRNSSETCTEPEFTRVLVIHDRSRKYKTLPKSKGDKSSSGGITKLATSSEKTVRFKKRRIHEEIAKPVQNPSKNMPSILKKTTISGNPLSTGTIRSKPTVSGTSSLNPQNQSPFHPLVLSQRPEEGCKPLPRRI